MNNPALDEPDRWISRSRYLPYLRAANQDRGAAERLYRWNIDISNALFADIQHLEVCVRNMVDTVMREYEVAPRVRTSPPAGWWFNNEAYVSRFACELARREMERLKDSRQPQLVRDRVLAALSFGYWTELFGDTYETLWRNALHRAFGNAAGPLKQQLGIQRKDVAQRLDRIRKVRNRIAHHEPIHQLDLADVHSDILTLLRWISSDLESWVQQGSRVAETLLARPEPPSPLAVVVPAREAWPLYEQTHAYICQPGRFFRQASHIGFYADAEIKADVAKILDRIDHVPFTRTEAYRREHDGSADGKRIGAIISAAMRLGWNNDSYQIFLLSTGDAKAIGSGQHVRLPAPLTNAKRGRGSAFVRKQRYFYLSELIAARSLAELVVSAGQQPT